MNSDGTPALTRGELAERLLEIASGDDDGEAKTGRRFYYLALSYGYLRPDMGSSDAAKKSREAAYDRVTAVLGILRKQGRLAWDMVLDLTRELDEWQTYGSPREARAALRRRYDEDRWLGQRYYPIFIVEKDTMEPVCRPMASRWQMPFASSRGYSSLKLQHDVAEMLNRRFARTGQMGHRLLHQRSRSLRLRPGAGVAGGTGELRRPRHRLRPHRTDARASGRPR